MDSNKRRLLKVATVLFAKKGYAEVSTREICEKANINLGGISYHFGGKEGLCLAVVEEFMKKLVRSFQQIQIPQEAEPITKEKLTEYFTQFIKTLIEIRISFPEAEILSYHRLFHEIPEMKNVVEKTLDPVFNDFTKLLSAAKRQNLIAADFNSRSFLVLMIKSIWGYISVQSHVELLWNEAYRLPQDKKEFTEFLVSLLTRGVYV